MCEETASWALSLSSNAHQLVSQKTSTGTFPAASQMYEVVSELLLHIAAQQGNGPERKANTAKKMV